MGGIKDALSVLVGAYGDHPELSLRCVDSLTKFAENREKLQIHVGCSECSDRVVQELSDRYANGQIDSLFLCRKNINKDPMMRILLQRVETEYLLWLDDDSHFIEKGWDTALFDFISRETDLDVAGHIYFCHRDESYTNFVKNRPWFRGREPEDDRVFFATGGCWLARTSFLLSHGFPDWKMVKKLDDLLLGDLCFQQNGNLKDFSHDKAIMDKVKISDGDRRGAGEGDDGWR